VYQRNSACTLVCVHTLMNEHVHVCAHTQCHGLVEVVKCQVQGLPLEGHDVT
jgi:hypothetical protein